MSRITLALAALLIDSLSGFDHQLHHNKPVSLVIPKGPFILHERLFQARNGVVFRVTDSNKNDYALKAVSLPVDTDQERKIHTLGQFNREKMWFGKTNTVQCAAIGSAKPGQTVTCPNHHVLYGFGHDVSDIQYENGTKVPVTSGVTMVVPKASGRKSEDVKNIYFGSNILMQYMPGGRLVDLLQPAADQQGYIGEFSSMITRFPLFQKIAPQLVTSLRFLHSKAHMIHLGMSPKTVLCSDTKCSDAAIFEYFNTWDGKVPTPSTPPAASELMQDSVVLATGAEDGKNSETKEIRSLLSSPSLTFDEAKSVDWYALGGTLFNIISGTRAVVDERKLNNPSVALQAEKVVAPENKKRNSAVHMLTASLSKSMRSEVVESMLLIDGLLQEDRKRRISFDIEDATTPAVQQKEAVAKQSLRAGRRTSLQKAAVPDVIEAPIPHVTNTTGVNCEEYMKQGGSQLGKNSHLGVFTPNHTPTFMKGMCVPA
ncbi:hypothetical protein Pmar_PMAR009971 [Perkinsus marinus ATCC 50983]|uniref:Protein kinase domain-containing protein n=1 Tax=Perkinsus marinus (strain ATCC 50983 / TXsc) TaxID=423536 RepID=C5L2R4_PERM5|nr:hypothetical protein Pmar_PMAR009971 [Perkinsus marinus ATCC 50983]EER08979.1 hypothetical protein Pmar_PMAR009971 [Perkinsus marinus ATCC 50983]|eukprot:XP_002777163.1 hypothetical protein Pmar_PMAR009971 [Perkinsus marinus ATCC 50983]